MTSPGAALDAVLADIRHHRITPDLTGLHHVTRHIELLCQLATRTAIDVEYQLVPNIADPPSVESLAVSTAHLGKAIAHYTRSLEPLLYLHTARQKIRRKHWLATEHRGALRVHLNGAQEALADARTALTPPPPPTSATPAAPTPKPPHAPGPRGRS
ncbi:hypothetical protein ACFZAT_08690 [Streptomyces sp. NPDC008163]|uniref:hypothetical protein n=1 Tax=Streptomyces sp. NPDC008163 TaxID=3364818 RepID=UPI0036E2BD8A